MQEFSKDLSSTYFKHTKSLLKWAYRLDYLNIDLGDKIYTLRDIVPRKKEKLYYEKKELEEIYLKLEHQPNTFINKELRLLIEFLVLTGLRIGEALALSTSDVDEYTLRVNKNISHENVLSTPKTKAGEREIILNNRAKQIILEMDFLKRTYSIKSDIIFCSKKGQYIFYSFIIKKINKIGVNGFHIFRHTHASLLAENGIPLEMIQRRLGHENDQITKDIYVHVTEKQKEKETEIFRGLEL